MKHIFLFTKIVIAFNWKLLSAKIVYTEDN